jgi:hypothetical protein
MIILIIKAKSKGSAGLRSYEISRGFSEFHSEIIFGLQTFLETYHPSSGSKPGSYTGIITINHVS